MLPSANLLFISFFITIISECVLVVLIMRKEKPFLKILCFILLIHFITHPFGAFLYYLTAMSFIGVEVVIILIEAIFYRKFFLCSYRKAFLISAGANAFSITVGMITRAYLIEEIPRQLIACQKITLF